MIFPGAKFIYSFPINVPRAEMFQDNISPPKKNDTFSQWNFHKKSPLDPMILPGKLTRRPPHPYENPRWLAPSQHQPSAFADLDPSPKLRWVLDFPDALNHGTMGFVGMGPILG